MAGFHRLTRLPQQLLRRTPFQGDVRPTRVPILSIGSGRPSLPFPHSLKVPRTRSSRVRTPKAAKATKPSEPRAAVEDPPQAG